jgi:hypothetical protein
VFLSYSNKDKAIAARMRRALEAADVKVLMDVGDLSVLYSFEVAILENRNRSRRKRIGNKDSRRHAFVLSSRTGAGWPHAAAASAALALA